MNANLSLRSRIRRAGRRLVAIGAAAATGWGLLTAGVLLLAGGWMDLLWELSPEWRVAVAWSSAAAGAGLAGGLIWRAVLAARPSAIARQLDRAVGSGGEILTGWELDGQYLREGRRGEGREGREEGRERSPATALAGIDASHKRLLTVGLSHLAVEQAAVLAGRAPLGKAIPLRPLTRPLAALVVFLALAALAAALMPNVFFTEWQRFSWPWADVPPYSPIQFTVAPGDVEVLYGSELEVVAEADAPIEQLELVLEPDGGGDASLPMFPEADGSWRAILAKVTEPGMYYVRSYRSRSERYRIDVTTVPRIETVRVRVVPPRYAGQAIYEGPIPEEGVKGLRGTKVTLWIASNRPLGGGEIVVSLREKVGVRGSDADTQNALTPGHSPQGRGEKDALTPGPSPKGRGERNAPGPSRKGRGETVSMTPTAAGSQEVSGEWEIKADGRFEARVFDDAGQASQQSVAAGVTLLPDQHPFIRVLRPQPVSLATPTAAVPVHLSAEDDCGISRVQLFRSLNESRPMPADSKIATAAPHRAEPQVTLPLDRYGLAPGDVIKLFGRVEDNDPAGAKGAESQVVAIRIISQEDFDKMLRTRRGLEMLVSKYREAQRRGEGLAKETEGLRKKLQKLPKQSALTQETRQELQKLQRLMRREADALGKSALGRLPYDVDAKLSSEIGQMARMTEEMLEELEKLQKQLDLVNEDLEKKLDEMAKRLAGQRRQFAQQAMEPMEHLAAVFPLLVDQSRFVALALRQRDLADRMAALRGHDGEDNPAMKSRMRDLEHEQRQIREALDRLLDDIEDHVTRLPDDPELAKLRETATEFVKDVRASGATEAMREAEAALTDFAGTRAHDKAKLAADILEKFIARCEGEGGLAGMCKGCLVFQPSLGFGNTVAQLMADMGGMSGGMGGYGTFGLYGAMGGMSGAGSGEYGEPSESSGGRGEAYAGSESRGGNPDQPSADQAPISGSAAGSSEAMIPIRYRQRVGQYFQRLAEEIGNEPPPRRGK